MVEEMTDMEISALIGRSVGAIQIARHYAKKREKEQALD